MAKAVRIRIRSGNEEHTTVESLRNNFDLNDIIPLLVDGRLERWLRQKQENDLADTVCCLTDNIQKKQNDNKNLLELIKAFFTEIKNSNLEELAELWYKDNKFKKNGKYLYRYIFRSNNFEDLVNRSENKSLPPDFPLTELFSEEQAEQDTTGNLDYVFGKYYIESADKDAAILNIVGCGLNILGSKDKDEDIAKGIELMKRAVRKNNLKAKTYLEKEEKLHTKDKNISKNRKKIDDIKKKRPDLEGVGKYSVYWRAPEYKLLVNDIEIRNYIEKFPDIKEIELRHLIVRSQNEMKSLMLKFMLNIMLIHEGRASSDDLNFDDSPNSCYYPMLCREAKLIFLIISAPKRSEYKRGLTELITKFDYEPAKCLLKPAKYHNSFSDSYYSNLKKFCSMDEREQVVFIINHIFEF